MMKVRLALTMVSILCVACVVSAGEPAPVFVQKLAHEVLFDLGTDPVIVAAVKDQNAQHLDLEEIKARDIIWRNYAGISPNMAAHMESDCGKHLVEVMYGAPYYAEIFVMDALGANVAMTDKTSDYWQGDERKFLECFTGWAGAVFVDEVEFDESTMAFLSQISVPVRDGGQVIGVITFGINVEAIEGQSF